MMVEGPSGGDETFVMCVACNRIHVSDTTKRGDRYLLGVASCAGCGGEEFVGVDLDEAELSTNPNR